MTDPTMLALALLLLATFLLGVHCGRATRPAGDVTGEVVRRLRDDNN